MPRITRNIFRNSINFPFMIDMENKYTIPPRIIPRAAFLDIDKAIARKTTNGKK